MGSKRIGLARAEALMENVKKEEEQTDIRKNKCLESL